ncbi:unnamed protein product [Taenia asiatica]|uniref:Fibronectin type-III domain-containing protein n=1 Tax=Taenia asiatica TaxID=60517 RepID=A0A0R3WHD9_TAEAS|nr:unnamed protein product [Taenia asiatica]
MTNRCILICAELDPPQNVSLQAVNSTAVCMRWDPPPNSTDLLIGYRLKWKVNGRWQPFIDVDKVQNHTIGGLQPEQKVTVYVKGRTKNEDTHPTDYINEYSDGLTVTTLPLDRGEFFLLVLSNVVLSFEFGLISPK